MSSMSASVSLDLEHYDEGHSMQTAIVKNPFGNQFELEFEKMRHSKDGDKGSEDS